MITYHRYNYRSTPAIVAVGNAIANGNNTSTRRSSSGSTNSSSASSDVCGASHRSTGRRLKAMMSMCTEMPKVAVEAGKTSTTTAQEIDTVATVPVRVVECMPSEEAQFQFVSDQINRMLYAKDSSFAGITESDIAVLFKHNATGKALKQFFKTKCKGFKTTLRRSVGQGEYVGRLQHHQHLHH